MFIANAASPASTNPIAEWLLATLFCILVAGVMAVLLIRLAIARRGRHVEAVSTLAVFWAVIAVASVSYFLIHEMDWNAEVQTKIDSGFYDESDQDRQPAFPISLWCGAGLGYLAMFGWVVAGKGDQLAQSG